IDARIGSSRPHSHVAHQISLAVERDLEISVDADMIVPAAHAIAIPSHVRHRLGPPGALVRSFYLDPRSEEHTSELQSLIRISYAVFCLKKKKQTTNLNP